MTEASIHVVIPAAGRGERMGPDQLPKQYQPLLGRPMLAWTLDCFMHHPQVDAITVALAPQDPHLEQLAVADQVQRVTGGDTRARSVLHGLAAARASGADWVLVHDAARPCLDQASLERLLAARTQSDHGAILALPVADTLKQAREARSPVIAQTRSRSGLWAAQTPQFFPAALLEMALQEALARGDAPTDEAGAMEAKGYEPLLVRGSPRNIKVTWPEDLLLAEMLLREERM